MQTSTTTAPEVPSKGDYLWFSGFSFKRALVFAVAIGTVVFFIVFVSCCCSWLGKLTKSTHRVYNKTALLRPRFIKPEDFIPATPPVTPTDSNSVNWAHTGHDDGAKVNDAEVIKVSQDSEDQWKGETSTMFDVSRQTLKGILSVTQLPSINIQGHLDTTFDTETTVHLPSGERAELTTGDPERAETSAGSRRGWREKGAGLLTTIKSMISFRKKRESKNDSEIETPIETLDIVEPEVIDYPALLEDYVPPPCNGVSKTPETIPEEPEVIEGHVSREEMDYHVETENGTPVKIREARSPEGAKQSPSTGSCPPECGDQMSVHDSEGSVACGGSAEPEEGVNISTEEQEEFDQELEAQLDQLEALAEAEEGPEAA